jgi:hypothetical protein
MGAWATDSFGNDDASDWLATLMGKDDLAMVEEALNAALAVGDDYLDAPLAAEALAAAEVVAAAKGDPGPDVQDKAALVAWLDNLAQGPDKTLVALAVQVVERVLADNSELRDLWEDSDEFDDWQTDVQALSERLLA